jgi:hypothetical protein
VRRGDATGAAYPLEVSLRVSPTLQLAHALTGDRGGARMPPRFVVTVSDGAAAGATGSHEEEPLMLRRHAGLLAFVLSLVVLLPAAEAGAQDASPAAGPPARDISLLRELGLPEINLIAPATRPSPRSPKEPTNQSGDPRRDLQGFQEPLQRLPSFLGSLVRLLSRSSVILGNGICQRLASHAGNRTSAETEFQIRVATYLGALCAFGGVNRSVSSSGAVARLMPLPF